MSGNAPSPLKDVFRYAHHTEQRYQGLDALNLVCGEMKELQGTLRYIPSPINEGNEWMHHLSGDGYALDAVFRYVYHSEQFQYFQGLNVLNNACNEVGVSRYTPSPSGESNAWLRSLHGDGKGLEVIFRSAYHAEQLEGLHGLSVLQEICNESGVTRFVPSPPSDENAWLRQTRDGLVGATPPKGLEVVFRSAHHEHVLDEFHGLLALKEACNETGVTRFVASSPSPGNAALREGGLTGTSPLPGQRPIYTPDVGEERGFKKTGAEVPVTVAAIQEDEIKTAAADQKKTEVAKDNNSAAAAEKEKSSQNQPSPSNNVVFFFDKDEKPYGKFSNFFEQKFFFKGRSWKTTEHAFQAMKFIHSPKDFEDIFAAKTPKEAATLGRDKSRPMAENWREIRTDVMVDILMAKFGQNESLRRLLLATGNKEIVEHTERDKYWGDGGGEGKGQNRLGKALMRVRTQLAKEDEVFNKEVSSGMFQSTLSTSNIEQPQDSNAATITTADADLSVLQSAATANAQSPVADRLNDERPRKDIKTPTSPIMEMPDMPARVLTSSELRHRPHSRPGGSKPNTPVLMRRPNDETTPTEEIVPRYELGTSKPKGKKSGFFPVIPLGPDGRPSSTPFQYRKAKVSGGALHRVFTHTLALLTRARLHDSTNTKTEEETLDSHFLGLRALHGAAMDIKHANCYKLMGMPESAWLLQKDAKQTMRQLLSLRKPPTHSSSNLASTLPVGGGGGGNFMFGGNQGGFAAVNDDAFLPQVHPQADQFSKQRGEAVPTTAGLASEEEDDHHSPHPPVMKTRHRTANKIQRRIERLQHDMDNIRLDLQSKMASRRTANTHAAALLGDVTMVGNARRRLVKEFAKTLPFEKMKQNKAKSAGFRPGETIHSQGAFGGTQTSLLADQARGFSPEGTQTTLPPLSKQQQKRAANHTHGDGSAGYGSLGFGAKPSRAAELVKKMEGGGHVGGAVTGADAAFFEHIQHRFNIGPMAVGVEGEKPGTAGGGTMKGGKVSANSNMARATTQQRQKRHDDAVIEQGKNLKTLFSM